MNTVNDAGPAQDSHWRSLRQNRYVLNSLRTLPWRGTCKFQFEYEKPFNPIFDRCDRVAGHMMQTKWVKRGTFLPMRCDMCGDRLNRFHLNGCGCHCGFDVCDKCLCSIREFQKTEDFTGGKLVCLDAKNKIQAAEHLAEIKSMCPSNEVFVYTCRSGDIHKEGIQCDLIRFKGDNGQDCVGYFTNVTVESRNRLTVQCVKPDPLSYDDCYYGRVQADNFIESWEYVYPDLRKHHENKILKQQRTMKRHETMRREEELRIKCEETKRQDKLIRQEERRLYKEERRLNRVHIPTGYDDKKKWDENIEYDDDETYSIYNSIGAEKTHTLHEIKQAIKAKLLKVHPDKGGDTQYFLEVQRKSKLLTNNNLRKRYDRQGDWLRFEGGKNVDPDFDCEMSNPYAV